MPARTGPLISRRLLVVVVACIAAAACGRDDGIDPGGGSGVIRFSVLSADPAENLKRSWAPVIADMEASTGLKVKPDFSNNDNALVEAMRDRRTDLGRFSNPSGLEAVRRANGEVFARTFDPPGAAADASVLIVNVKSKLTLDRVLKCDRTLTLAMGETLSTPGTLAPETYLFAPRGIRPAACFKQVRAASPQVNLAAVATGQIDAATVGAASLALNRRNGRHDAEAVRAIWTSPALPQDPIIWRRDLDPAIKEKLRQFFLTYGQDEGPTAAAQRANLARIGVGGFRPADNGHLLPVREMEATRVWLEATAGGDKAKIDAARRALNAITAQRQDLEARTRAPAAAQ
ncbi:MAG TPA: phosphate/phosphite/phosphonate ABC transporter substrate-binding protein [Caulobacteraceae bacterium]